MSRSTLSITNWCSGFSSPYSSRHAAARENFGGLGARACLQGRRGNTANCKTNLFAINPFIAQKPVIAGVEPRLWSHFWHNQFWKITFTVNSCRPFKWCSETCLNMCDFFTPTVQLCLKNLNEDLHYPRSLPLKYIQGPLPFRAFLCSNKAEK